MSVIYPNLLLGKNKEPNSKKTNNSFKKGDASEAKDIKFLQSKNVTHILCVARELKPYYPKTFVYKHIQALDEEDFPLINYFDEMADFIDEGTTGSGVVFVHCAFGVSRSPTAIMSYLIKHKKMDFYKAKYFVQDKRREVYPNDGFLKQLQSYDQTLKMKQKENSIQSIFKEAKRKKGSGKKSVEKEPKENLVEENKEDLIEKSEKMVEGSPLKVSNVEEKFYKCRRCRSIIFSSTNIVHENRPGGTPCSSIFLEKPEWVILEKNEEFKLNCPNKKCLAKLGIVKLSGHKCDCGKWIAPAYQIHRKDIDEDKLMKGDLNIDKKLLD